MSGYGVMLFVLGFRKGISGRTHALWYGLGRGLIYQCFSVVVRCELVSSQSSYPNNTR
jgi:hypothetical protein